MPNAPSCTVFDTLAAGLGAVARLADMAPDGRHRMGPQAVESAVSNAHKALAAGEPGALQAAQRSLELLSFELCDD